MADFNITIEHIIEAEGGYRLIKVPGDRGGLTCAGISQRANPTWEGWKLLAEGASPKSPEVKAAIHRLYRTEYWDEILGDDIANQDFATMAMSCAVLSGVGTSVRFLQMVTGAKVDGDMGPKTLAAVNAKPASEAMMAFTVGRIARFAGICNRTRKQQKFLLGWINRALGELT